jgi:hypothetical protein
MCGTRRNGCRPHEQCINGLCVCKTSFCDQCNNACKSNEICLDGKCVCKERCEKGKIWQIEFIFVYAYYSILSISMFEWRTMYGFLSMYLSTRLARLSMRTTAKKKSIETEITQLSKAKHSLHCTNKLSRNE